MLKVGLCGTIGSGKSTVCRIFERLGVAVYIADDRAKELMVRSESLVADITAAFGAECYKDGVLNRAYLASQIFGNDAARLQLNAIVHPAVCRDFVEWAERQSGDYVIVESAILFESGLDKVVDKSVAVVAPAEISLARAMARDGVDRSAVEARMAVQRSADELASMTDFVIENIDLQNTEAQVVDIDSKLRVSR